MIYRLFKLQEMFCNNIIYIIYTEIICFLQKKNLMLYIQCTCSVHCMADNISSFCNNFLSEPRKTRVHGGGGEGWDLKYDIIPRHVSWHVKHLQYVECHVRYIQHVKCHVKHCHLIHVGHFKQFICLLRHIQHGEWHVIHILHVLGHVSHNQHVLCHVKHLTTLLILSVVLFSEILIRFNNKTVQ